MKLAFISDIHANLPALQAVMADIAQYRPDGIYCLGDLVNFAGWDNEVIDLIRERDIPTICGNHDEGISRGLHTFAYSYANDEQKKFGVLSIQKVNETLTTANREYLTYLPFMVQLEYRFAIHHVRLAMVHGSISSNGEYVYENADEAYLIDMMDSINADILLMGHTHKPYHRMLYSEEENTKLYRHAINVGSVGKPKHGTPEACYAMLYLNRELALSDPYSVRVQFRYVPYDTEAVVRHIRDSGLPDAYDAFVRNGK